MVLVIVLAVLVVFAIVVVAWRSRLHTGTIEERGLPTGHVDLVRPPEDDADASACAICGEVFATRGDLDRHLAEYHPQSEPRT